MLELTAVVDAAVLPPRPGLCRVAPGLGGVGCGPAEVVGEHPVGEIPLCVAVFLGNLLVPSLARVKFGGHSLGPHIVSLLAIIVAAVG